MSSHSRPTLKPSVDLQLQNAFRDGNWPQAARLADKRAKALKDPYYQAIAVAAESQLDTAQEKCAALVAVDSCLKNGTAVKDGEILDLYEWACRDLLDESQYSDTHGQLRLRLVKAAPRDKPTVLHCLRLCLLHWDLVNAQQIAAVLDKTFVSERNFLFWNILVTFMLSTSSQCPPEKQKLYSLLALKQLERAADLREKEDNNDRAIRSEEEQLLLFRALAVQGSRDTLLQKMKSPVLGGLASFEHGRKHLLLEALDAFDDANDQNTVFDMCNRVLSSTYEDGSLNLLGSDWSVWKKFIAAASAQEDNEKAFARVQTVLESYVAHRHTLRPVYARIISLALLETTFTVPPELTSSGTESESIRVAQIRIFLEQNFDKLACFDDLKPYIEKLSFGDAKTLIHETIPALKNEDRKRTLLLDVLALKFRYLLCTSTQPVPAEFVSWVEDAQPLLVCKWCESGVTTTCNSCLQQIVVEAMERQQLYEKDPAIGTDFEGEDVDPVEELTLVAAMSLIKLSGLRQHAPTQQPISPLLEIDMRPFLQAVAILDHHLSKKPNRAPIRILLIHLYLLLGCASYAYQIWLPLDVKRTIQDSLSPLFFDRIASVAPGLFRTGPGFRRIVEPMRSYYKNCLKLRTPSVLWDALEAGSYTSVLDIAEYMNNLRYSCTLVMSLLEERRGVRALLGKSDSDVNRTSFIASITPETKLAVATDYGSLPSLESSRVAPLSEVVRLGPGLSNTRSHLEILTEQFLDLVSYTPPKEYRPLRALEAHNRDKLYVMESADRLYESFTLFLQAGATAPSYSILTPAETHYYTIVSLLAALVPAVLCLSKEDQNRVPEDVSLLLQTIFSTLSLAAQEFSTSAPPSSNFAFLAFGSVHQMSVFLWSAQAVKHTISFLRGYNEKQLSLDKTGKSVFLSKSLLRELKPVEEETERALKSIRDRVGAMKSALDEAGWMDKLAGWAFGSVAVDIDEEEEEEQDGEDRKYKDNNDKKQKEEVAEKVYDAIGGMAGCETWGVKILESWRDGVKGWGLVRID